MKFEDIQLSGSLDISGSMVLPLHAEDSDVSNPIIGDLYFNTVSQSVKVYNGTGGGWQVLADQTGGEDISPTVTIDYLVVAGGGGGGARRGSGGGGGGLRATTGSATSGGGGTLESPLAAPRNSSLTITVGAGGTGAAAGTATYGSKGGDSSISGDSITTITSIGGGSGISLGSAQTSSQDGGCGAGGGARGASSLYEAPPLHFGDGTTGQGYDGGYGSKAHDGGGGGGGGGGGAGSAGENGAGDVNNSYGQACDGGDGLANDITGTSITYSEGGNAPNGIGGSYRTNMDANSGDGSSGNAETDGNSNASGNGGSGVVILRMLTSDYSGTTTGSPTVTTDGSDTILKFTQSGTYTV